MLIGSEWVCLFGHDQSGVDAALCRAHSKTPSFFRRHASESIPIANIRSKRIAPVNDLGGGSSRTLDRGRRSATDSSVRV
jgi:hypothetical protein